MEFSFEPSNDKMYPYKLIGKRSRGILFFKCTEEMCVLCRQISEEERAKIREIYKTDKARAITYAYMIGTSSSDVKALVDAMPRMMIDFLYCFIMGEIKMDGGKGDE